MHSNIKDILDTGDKVDNTHLKCAKSDGLYSFVPFFTIRYGSPSCFGSTHIISARNYLNNLGIANIL